jgi:hypothetical protein
MYNLAGVCVCLCVVCMCHVRAHIIIYTVLLLWTREIMK